MQILLVIYPEAIILEIFWSYFQILFMNQSSILERSENENKGQIFIQPTCVKWPLCGRPHAQGLRFKDQ